MLSTLFTAAAVSLAGLLPLPLPIDPTTGGHTESAAAPAAVSGTLDAPDGRLKRGCKDYRYAYSVATESDDWTFDITMQDRRGKGVSSQSLLGPNDGRRPHLPPLSVGNGGWTLHADRRARLLRR